MGQGTLGVIKMSRYRTTMAEALQKVYETPQGFALVSKAKEIAKKFANNMTKAVAEIEKLEKGLSKNSSVRDALQKANEELAEGKMKDIFTADQEGKSAAEIAKTLKLPLATVKKILGESSELSEFTSDMIKRLKKSYSTMPQRISTAQADALSRHLDRLDLVSLKKLAKEKIPFLTTLARNKIYKKTGKFEEYLNEEENDGSALAIKEKEIESLKNQLSLMKQKVENEKNKAIKPVPNPETGEVPLTIGLAHKLLKDKDEKEAKEKKQKENSDKIKSLAKGEKLESFTRKYLQHLNITESEVSDKAKGMGLTYMKFGRYGKDGKVTHKSIGGNLTAVDKDEKPIKEPTKKSDEPKKDTAKVKEVEPIEVKSKKFLQSLEAGEIEDVDLDFDDEGSFEAAAEKARSMGLDDVADDIDSVGGYVMEMEPEKAQAEYQDMMSKYSGKPVKALEFSKQADEAIELLSGGGYVGSNFISGENTEGFADDLSNTLSIMKQMVDSDETEGNVGSGMSNSSKGFRPEVIGTLQSVSDIMDIAVELSDANKDQKVKDILSQIEGELDFIQDENADHDNYTKPHKVNSAINSAIELTKQLQMKLKEEADLSKPQIKKVHKMADELPKKDFKDRYGKEKGDSVRYATATNIVKKKEGIKEQMRLRIESMAALKKKADKSGMPYSILKKVFDRGMAAWKGGHRPGASQHQWAYARVNSFTTKSSGTWGGADKDLAAKVKGSK